jgi:hypothetical protein
MINAKNRTVAAPPTPNHRNYFFEAYTSRHTELGLPPTTIFEILWGNYGCREPALLGDGSEPGSIGLKQAAIQDPGGSDLRHCPYCYMRLSPKPAVKLVNWWL